MMNWTYYELLKIDIIKIGKESNNPRERHGDIECGPFMGDRLIIGIRSLLIV